MGCKRGPVSPDEPLLTDEYGPACCCSLQPVDDRKKVRLGRLDDGAAGTCTVVSAAWARCQRPARHLLPVHFDSCCRTPQTEAPLHVGPPVTTSSGCTLHTACVAPTTATTTTTLL